MQRSRTTFHHDNLVLLQPLAKLLAALSKPDTVDSDNHTTVTDYSPTATTIVVGDNTATTSPDTRSFIAVATTPSVVSVPPASSWPPPAPSRCRSSPPASS